MICLFVFVVCLFVCLFVCFFFFSHFIFFCSDPNQEESRASVASALGLHPDQVVCGAGSDDILEIIIRAFQLSAVFTASPTFSMYAFLARLNVPNVPLVDVPRHATTFVLNVPALVQAIRDHSNQADKIPLVFLASPNNPTGNYLSHVEAKELLKERCILVVDEAYIEFSEHEGCLSAIALLKDHPNLIVTRTLSKWAGLAGLRVGFSFSSREIAQLFMSAKQPYHLDWPAVAATRAVYANREVNFVEDIFGVLKRFFFVF